MIMCDLVSKESFPRLKIVSPNISGNVLEHFEHIRYFVRPQIKGYATVQFFFLVSNMFRYFPNVFWNMSKFSVTFGHFLRHLRPRWRCTFGPLRYNSWNSQSCKATTCRRSSWKLPSTFCVTTSKEATTGWRAKRQSSLQSF